MATGLIDIEAILVHRTERAALVKDAEDSDPVWLPASQIEVEEGHRAGFAIITMPEWLALEKGLI